MNLAYKFYWKGKKKYVVAEFTLSLYKLEIKSTKFT